MFSAKSPEELKLDKLINAVEAKLEIFNAAIKTVSRKQYFPSEETLSNLKKYDF